MVVSLPIKIQCEIEDLETGCSYVYKGNSIKDCVVYFQDLFFGYRKYKILWYKPTTK